MQGPHSPASLQTRLAHVLSTEQHCRVHPGADHAGRDPGEGGAGAHGEGGGDALARTRGGRSVTRGQQLWAPVPRPQAVTAPSSRREESTPSHSPGLLPAPSLPSQGGQRWPGQGRHRPEAWRSLQARGPGPQAGGHPTVTGKPVQVDEAAGSLGQGRHQGLRQPLLPRPPGGVGGRVWLLQGPSGAPWGWGSAQGSQGPLGGSEGHSSVAGPEGTVPTRTGGSKQGCGPRWAQLGLWARERGWHEGGHEGAESLSGHKARGHLADQEGKP